MESCARIFESRCLRLRFEKNCKSWSRTLNAGLGESRILPFYTPGIKKTITQYVNVCTGTSL